MGRFPIGVIIDSFRTDIPTAVKKAAECGAQGIQVYSTSGEMAPENLSAQQRKDFLNLVKDNGLVISALCGDLGGGGFIHKGFIAFFIPCSGIYVFYGAGRCA